MKTHGASGTKMTGRIFQASLFVLLTLLCSCGGPKWQGIGPSHVTHKSKDLPWGARADDIKISTNYDGKGNPAMFLACPGGGVWRSADFTSAEPTWVPLTDNVPNIKPETRRININFVSCIAIDPNHPQTIYAGAGGGPLALLKSADGGDHWAMVGQGMTTNSIFGLTVDDHGYVYVGSNNAFYASQDGGNTFRNVNQLLPDGVDFVDTAYYKAQNAVTGSVYVGVVGRGDNGFLSGMLSVSWDN